MERFTNVVDQSFQVGQSPCLRATSSAIKSRTWITSVFAKSVGSQLRLSQNDLLVQLATDHRSSNTCKSSHQVTPKLYKLQPSPGVTSSWRTGHSSWDYRTNMLTDRDMDLLQGGSSFVDDELDHESSFASTFIDCDYHHGYSHDVASAYGDYSEIMSNVEMKIKRRPWSNVASDVTEMMGSPSQVSSRNICPVGSVEDDGRPLPVVPENYDFQAGDSRDCLDEFNPYGGSRRHSSPMSSYTPDPVYRWIGKFPALELVNPTFSTKVFLGGLPRGISESDIINTFKRFGEVKLSWPKEKYYHRHFRSIQGFIYLRFESDKNVKAVLRSCSRSETNSSEWYYPIQWDGFKKKGVQVIPWQTRDNTYSENCAPRLDSRKTVFVGALHGRLTARALFCIMNDLFRNVLYVGLDTDMNKYPIGSGRVTFSTEESFMKAVTCGFVGIDTPEFSKVIQIDPYLEDSECGMCETDLGPYFCRDLTCFGYYCERCWRVQHNLPSVFHHKPLTRKIDH